MLPEEKSPHPVLVPHFGAGRAEETDAGRAALKTAVPTLPPLPSHAQLLQDNEPLLLPPITSGLSCATGAESFWKICLTPLGKKYKKLNRRNKYSGGIRALGFNFSPGVPIPTFF